MLDSLNKGDVQYYDFENILSVKISFAKQKFLNWIWILCSNKWGINKWGSKLHILIWEFCCL